MENRDPINNRSHKSGKEFWGAPDRGAKKINTPRLRQNNSLDSRWKICKRLITRRPKNLTLRQIRMQTIGRTSELYKLKRLKLPENGFANFLGFRRQDFTKDHIKGVFKIKTTLNFATALKFRGTPIRLKAS